MPFSQACFATSSVNSKWGHECSDLAGLTEVQVCDRQRDLFRYGICELLLRLTQHLSMGRTQKEQAQCLPLGDHRNAKRCGHRWVVRGNMIASERQPLTTDGVGTPPPQRPTVIGRKLTG